MGLSLAKAQRDAVAEARALLPLGEAWSDDPRSVLGRLLSGLSTWRARTDVRGAEILVESDPRTTTELLADWERSVGLPDECLPAPQGIEERRALVISRLIGNGGASRAFLLSLARAIGYEVTITEGAGTVLRAGIGRAGDSVGSELEDFVWTVTAPFTLIRYARAGIARAGDPVAQAGNELLECVMRRANPAHTLVRFIYAQSCWLFVFDENGAPVQVLQVGSAIPFYTETGVPLLVPIENDSITIFDENGNPYTSPISCSPFSGPYGGGGGGGAGGGGGSGGGNPSGEPGVGFFPWTNPGGEPVLDGSVLIGGAPGNLHAWNDLGVWTDALTWTD